MVKYVWKGRAQSDGYQAGPCITNALHCVPGKQCRSCSEKPVVPNLACVMQYCTRLLRVENSLQIVYFWHWTPQYDQVFPIGCEGIACSSYFIKPNNVLRCSLCSIPLPQLPPFLHYHTDISIPCSLNDTYQSQMFKLCLFISHHQNFL